MRRITLWALSTLTTLVLLFSYHTSTSSRSAAAAAPVIAQATSPSPTSSTPQATTPSDSSTSSGSSGSSSGTDGASGTSTSTPTPSKTSSSSSWSAAAKTYDGDAVNTRYGNVQVQITVAAGKITAAQVLQVPWNDHRDQEINSYAVPVLNSEVVQAQNANIDMVSGATYTSDGYIQSLQSAIDQAHL